MPVFAGREDVVLAVDPLESFGAFPQVQDKFVGSNIHGDRSLSGVCFAGSD